MFKVTDSSVVDLTMLWTFITSDLFEQKNRELLRAISLLFREVSLNLFPKEEVYWKI